MTTDPKPGDTAICQMCGGPIVYIGPAWDHPGAIKPKHPALPVEAKRQFTPDEIRATYELMQSAARVASLVDLAAARAVLDSMHYMDSVMPITDPTGWMHLRKTAPAHQQFAAAFVRFRTVLEEFRPEVDDE